MADYYATTQVSVNTAEEGEPRKIDYLPAYKKAPESEWKDALGDEQFEAFVKEGVLVEVTEDTKVDDHGFIHFQRIGSTSSVVDDPNAPPDEDVKVSDEDVATAESQRGEGTGKPPGLGTEETPEDERSLADSGTPVTRDAASPRAEETAAKGGPPAKAATNEAARSTTQATTKTEAGTKSTAKATDAKK